MSTTWNWSGARWWKCDLHAHTPKSEEYGAGCGQADLKVRTAQDWVLDHMRAGLDCVAVTDHNSGEWIDELKQAETALEQSEHADYRKLYIFPGVELSVNNGFHVLVVLDPAKTGHDVAALIGACGYRGTPGTCDDVTDKSFIEVVKEVVTLGGIVIPAHVDVDRKGLWTQTDPNTWQQVLNSKYVSAWEVVDQAAVKPRVIADSNKTFVELLGSDSHRPTEVARGFSWIKMTAPSLEGLRLALTDGTMSVRRSDQVDGDPNECRAQEVIESFEVVEAKYMGRPAPKVFSFNPWMNAIIGGRGTGKSSLLEFMRLTLRRDKDPEFVQCDKVQSEFGKYKSDKKEQNGLLTDTTEFRLIYRKGDYRYRLHWRRQPAIEEQKEDGAWTDAAGDVRKRFPVRIYSQKQIYEMAESPTALLGVIDAAPEVGKETWLANWKSVVERMSQLRRDLAEIAGQLVHEPALRGERDDVQKTLTEFQRHQHKEVFQAHQRMQQQKRALEVWLEAVQGIPDRIRTLVTDLEVPDVDTSLFNPNQKEDQDLLERIAAGNKVLSKRVADIRNTAYAIQQAMAKWTTAHEASEWAERLGRTEKAYAGLIEEVGDPAKYQDKMQRLQILTVRLKEMDSLKEREKELRKQLQEAIDNLLSVRRDLTERRQKFLDGVLKDSSYVRITVVPYGSEELAEEGLRTALLREDKSERDFEKIIGNLYGDGDNAYTAKWRKETATRTSLSEDFENRLAKEKAGIVKVLNGEESAAFSGWLVNHLRRLANGSLEDSLNRLESWFPEDSVSVAYGDPRTNKFQPVEGGSPGQKTAAMLAFLLTYGTDPMLLDQPEDDLDNHLIYDLVVTQLAENKLRRQLLIVSHNANIVVNGDAELVTALTARGGQTQVEASGGMQEEQVRTAICTIMEGGKDAFRRRYERLGGDANV